MKKTYKILLLCFFLYLFSISLKAANLDEGLFRSEINPDEFEVNIIRFEGNDNFEYNVLYNVITTRPSDRSIIHKVLYYYDYQIDRNSPVKSFLPSIFINSLDEAIETLSYQIRFFSEPKVKQDMDNIKKFYNIHGFHDADVKYSFEPDSSEKGNALIFHIDEGNVYKIRSIEFSGLDTLPKTVEEKISETQTIELNKPYQEMQLMRKVTQINRILLNEGYYSASYETPVIVIDTLTITDSIFVQFNKGRRRMFGEITFVDSLGGQKRVTNNMKDKQLTFNKGDWYSREKVNESIDNLFSLGTFDIVSIDTTSQFEKSTDSTLPFRVFTQYRKQQEYGFSFLVNQTQIEKETNMGIDVSYFNRNIGGIAQVFNPFARVLLKDLSRSLKNIYNAEVEFQGGFNFAQPLLWVIDRARIAFSMQFLYSNRTLYQSLRVNSFSVPVRFPIQLPTFTFFNVANIDFTFEREAPINYRSAVSDIEKDPRDSLEIVTLYGTLDEYVRNKEPILTANLLGASIVGDMRNNPFSPTRGYFFALSFDMINPLFSFSKSVSGIADYSKIQVTGYYFTPINPVTTFAFKQRIGSIFWRDRANSYVPFERQFFAGGANSIRGWQSRELRYPEVININHSNEEKEFLSNLVGSRVLIEGSLELRWQLPVDKNANDEFSRQIKNIGLTAFLDWGNAFHSMELQQNYEEYYQYEWYEYITKLALAAGVGFRYDTPVGPIRVDFAWKIYNPSLNRRNWLFERSDALLGDVAFHLGLGHAF